MTQGFVMTLSQCSQRSYFMDPPLFHVIGYFTFCLSMWQTTSKTAFQMTGWENLNILYKIEDQIIFFQK